MPDTIEPSVDQAALAAADKVSEELLARTRSAGNTPIDLPADPGREADLDKALAEVTADAEKTAAAAAAPAPAPAPEPAPAPAGEEKPDPAASTEKKGPLDDLLATAKAAPASNEAPPAPADPYSEVKLRSDASPKTRDTFEQLKTLAKQREEAATTRANELEAKFKEQETKLKELEGRVAAPEIESELKELRAFRAQFDTENDPSFKGKYDARIDTNYEAIYGKLAEHGLPPDEVAKLKAFGRAERDAAIDSFLEKLPSTSRRVIEAKLIDNQNTLDQRNQELSTARANADRILAEKAQAGSRGEEQRLTEVATHLRPVIEQLAWLKPKAIPPTAGAEERKSLEAANEFAVAAQAMVRDAVLDRSPQMQANGAIAIPLAHFYKRQFDATSAKLASVQAELDGIRKAGRTGRLADTIAVPGTAPISQPKPPADSGDALDQLMTQVLNEQKK